MAEKIVSPRSSMTATTTQRFAFASSTCCTPRRPDLVLSRIGADAALPIAVYPELVDEEL
jgi:hypothetical protein